MCSISCPTLGTIAVNMNSQHLILSFQLYSKNKNKTKNKLVRESVLLYLSVCLFHFVCFCSLFVCLFCSSPTRFGGIAVTAK